MDTKQFQDDIVEVLQRYYSDLAVFTFGVVFLNPEHTSISSYGNTIIPVPPRDHEDNLLRNKCAKDVTQLATDLANNVYLGR